MFLLTFTSLTETSILILKPIQFDGLNGMYIFFQPDTQYLTDTTHQVLFMLAVFIEIVLTIAVTILLLSPCLTRSFNSLKLKPFLDEFHGGYKDRYRFMAASYFTYRQVIFLITLMPPEYSASAIHSAITIMLIVHLVLRPYKSILMNIIDGIFLVTLQFVSYVYNNAFFSKENICLYRASITYLLLLFPAFYLLLLLILPCWDKVEQCDKYEILRSMHCPFIKNHRAEESRRNQMNGHNDLVLPLMVQEENSPHGIRENILSFLSSVVSGLQSENNDTPQAVAPTCTTCRLTPTYDSCANNDLSQAIRPTHNTFM